MFPTTSGSESMHHEHSEEKFPFLVESPESTSVSSDSSTEQSSTAEITHSATNIVMVQQAQQKSKETISQSKEAVFLADIESCSLRSGLQNCDKQEDEGTVDSRSPVYLATFDSISLTSNNTSTASRNHTSKMLPEITQEPNDGGSANATPSIDDLSDTEESLHYALRRELRDADEEAKNTSMHEILLEDETNFDIDDDCTIRSQSTFTVVPSDPSMVTSLFQYVGVSTICSCLTDFVFQASGVASITALSGAQSTSTRRQKKRLFSPRERRAAMEAILFLWTIPLPGPMDMSGVQKAKAVSATAHKEGRTTIDQEYVFEVTSLDGGQHDIDDNQYSHLEDPRKPLQSHISDLTSVSLGTHVCPLCSVHLDHATQANDDAPPAQIHCPHCHQRMHRDCLVDWLKHLNHQKCPCCRGELISDQLLKQTVERNRQQRQQHGHTITTVSSQEYSPIASKGPHESSRLPTASPDKSQKSTVWDIDELSQAGASPRGVGEEIIFQ